MTHTATPVAIPNETPTLQEALHILVGFVSNHADKGNLTAAGMVKFANAAIAADAENAAKPVIVVIEIDGGLLNVVESSHPVDVYVMDGDTEGGDESNIAKIDGQDFYLSNQSVSVDEAKGTTDAAFNATVAQIDAHFHSVPARLEWLWPDQESNSTAATVDVRTGVVTILDRSELDADYDDVSVIQRVTFEENADESFDVEAIGSDGWRILPELLDNFVVALDAREAVDSED